MDVKKGLYRYAVHIVCSAAGVAGVSGGGEMNDKAFVVICSPAALVGDAIKGGADVNARVPKRGGFTPLHAAAGANPDYKVIETLLKGGADVNAKQAGGYTPLHMAAGRNTRTKVITSLLEGGADVNARAENDVTTLHMAAIENTNPEVIRVLLGAGADVNAKTGKRHAAAFGRNGQYEP